MKMSTKRLQKPINQIIAVLDFQQFSYRQLNSRTVCQGAIEFFRIFEANYPEVLKTCYFINTPKIFPIFFAIVKPFLSTRTLNKMEFHGPHTNKWMRALQKKIPADILPAHYGGTREGKDEFCSDSGIWNDGDPLPLDYYSLPLHGGGTDSKLRKRSSIYEADIQNLELNGECAPLSACVPFCPFFFSRRTFARFFYGRVVQRYT